MRNAVTPIKARALKHDLAMYTAGAGALHGPQHHLSAAVADQHQPAAAGHRVRPVLQGACRVLSLLYVIHMAVKTVSHGAIAACASMVWLLAGGGG
jgi:hypothetical protein